MLAISTFSGNISNSGIITAKTGIMIGAGVGFAAGGAIVNRGNITGTGGTAIDASTATSRDAIVALLVMPPAKFEIDWSSSHASPCGRWTVLKAITSFSARTTGCLLCHCWLTGQLPKLRLRN